MDCKNCKKNYLLKIYNTCINNHDIFNDGLEEFHNICTRSNDPRSSVMILYSLMNNDCETCEKYRELYKRFIE